MAAAQLHSDLIDQNDNIKDIKHYSYITISPQGKPTLLFWPNKK
jgi:hypothetical protein